MRKLFALGLAAVMLFSCIMISIGVSAVEPIVTDSPVSLTLTYSYNGVVFEGEEVSLYRVGEVYPNSSFGLTEEFSAYALSLNTVKSQSEWNAIAQTAMSYVVADSVSPTAAAVTDSEGKVSYTELQTGLYLVSGVRSDYDKGYCSFDCFMIILPASNDDGTWSYKVEAKPKSLYVQTQPDDIEYSVIKLWKDTGYEAKRPAKVEVELYKDGAFAEKVVLSSENNWHYTWKSADDGAVWTAVETNVAAGYTVTIEQKDNAFVLANTYGKNPPPPQTGDSFGLGIYVVLLAVAGLGLVIIGVISRRKV